MRARPSFVVRILILCLASIASGATSAGISQSQSIPGTTAIPARFEHTIDSQKTKVGESVTARRSRLWCCLTAKALLKAARLPDMWLHLTLISLIRLPTRVNGPHPSRFTSTHCKWAISNVSILSRPAKGKEVVKIEIPLQALAKELEAQLPAAGSCGKEENGRKRKSWKAEITRAFEDAAGDLEGTTERDILDEIKRYRAERKKTPEISVIALPQEKTA